MRIEALLVLPHEHLKRAKIPDQLILLVVTVTWDSVLRSAIKGLFGPAWSEHDVEAGLGVAIVLPAQLDVFPVNAHETAVFLIE